MRTTTRASEPEDQNCNIEAEQQMLGAILVDNAVFDKVSDLISVDDFYDPVHQRVFQSITDRISAGALASPVTLTTAFKNDDGMAQLGGVGYLANLAGASIAISSARDYATMIAELSAYRSLSQSMTEATERMSKGDPIIDVAQRIESSAGDLLTKASIKPLIRTHLSAITGAVSRINDAYSGVKIPGISTGLPQLDQALGFMRPSNFIVLGGRPSMGKTTLAQSMAYHSALNGVGVFFGSLEMEAEELSQRFLSRGLSENGEKIQYNRMIKGQVSEKEMRAIIDEAKRQEAFPMATGERHVREISRLRAAIKRTHQWMDNTPCPLGLVIIDYLQLIQSSKAKSIHERVSEASDACKSIAQEYGVPVVALSQMNRAVESRDPPVPTLSDLRESGKLEEDADVVLFCYREAYYLEKKIDAMQGAMGEDKIDAMAALERCKDQMDIIIGKQRSGPLKTVPAFVDLGSCHVYADRSQDDENLI